MSNQLLQEVAETFGNKRYLVLGTDGEQYIAMDMASNRISIVTKQMLYGFANSLANAEVVNGVVNVTDISKTRLASIFEGDIFNFSYIIKRYKDAKDFTLGYLVYVFTNKNTVQLLKLGTLDALKTFEHGVVLNAKKVTREGQEIIAGIVKPLPETLMGAKPKEKPVAPTYEKATETLEVHKPREKPEKDYKKLYIEKVELKFLLRFLDKGYAASFPHTQDAKKRVQRFIEEVIRVKDVALYEWYKKSPTLVRALQLLDAYFADSIVEGRYNDYKGTMLRDMIVNAPSRNHYANGVREVRTGLQEVDTMKGRKASRIKSRREGAYTPVFTEDFKVGTLLFVHSNITSGIPTMDYSLNNVNRAGKTVLTTSRDGVINISDTSAIRDASALLEGVAIGELKLYVFKGVLASGVTAMPISSEAKYFLEARDAITVTLDNKERRHLISKGHQTTEELASILNKNFNVPYKVGYTNYYTPRVINSIVPANLNWSSAQAYKALKFRGVEELSLEDNAGGLGIPEDLFYTDNIMTADVSGIVKTYKEYINYVGDVRIIMLLDRLTDCKYGNWNEVDHYVNIEEKAAKLFALLILGNKELALAVAHTDPQLLRHLHVDTEVISKAPRVTTVAHQSGGAIGDDYPIVDYGTYISIRNNSKLSYETGQEVLKLATQMYPQGKFALTYDDKLAIF